MSESPPARERLLGYRWTICALLFFAITVSYVDRGVLGILSPTLSRELGWSETDYGDMVSWFSFAYAIGAMGAGRVFDLIGVKKGFVLSIVTWSIAAVSHAFVRTATGFSLARAALGLTESGGFPGAIKATAEWFPKKERALATGIFNAGSNVGAIVTPAVVPWLTLTWGWQSAFIVTGTLGLVWVFFWVWIYRPLEGHPRVSAAERAYILSDQDEPAARVPWRSLFRHRQTWAFVIAKGMTDPIWWFYLYWLPKFLDARFAVKLSGLAAPLIVIYMVANVGSIGGGWLSGALMKRGWSVNAGRKTAMLAAALLIVPTMFAPLAHALWLAVGIVSVAAAAHQWWSANIFTTASDMFPRAAVGSVVGLGTFAGAMGGVVFQRITGRVLEATHNNYSLIFLVCGFAYVTALLIMHLIVPRLQPAHMEEAR